MAWEDDNNEPNLLFQQQFQQNEAEMHDRALGIQKQRMLMLKSGGQQDFTGSNANAPIFGKPTIGM